METLIQVQNNIQNLKHASKDKFILFKGGIETLEYFSLELSKTFMEYGASVFFFDLLEEEESFLKLQEFCKDSNPKMSCPGLKKVLMTVFLIRS